MSRHSIHEANSEKKVTSARDLQSKRVIFDVDEFSSANNQRLVKLLEETKEKLSITEA